MIIAVIVLSILLIVSIIVAYKLLGKTIELEEANDDYDKMLSFIFGKITAGYEQIKSIDYKGYFEADDEVGIIFKELKSVITDLNKYVDEQ